MPISRHTQYVVVHQYSKIPVGNLYFDFFWNDSKNNRNVFPPPNWSTGFTLATECFESVNPTPLTIITYYRKGTVKM